MAPISFASVLREPIGKQSEVLDESVKGLYRSASRFLFNDSLDSRLTFTYLGCEIATMPMTGDGSLGRVRLDYFVIENSFHETVTLDIHVLVERNEYSLSELIVSTDNLVRAKHSSVIGFMYDLYWGSDEIVEAFPTLGRWEHALREHLGDRIPSKYLYVSICDQDAEVIVNWEKYSSLIYGLLFLHREGVDAELASGYLEGHIWGSTEFFRNFSQPGAIVSVSRPYPSQIYDANREYFLPSQGSLPCTRALPRESSMFETYDLLPEYPPLRYCGLLVGLYSGWIEEVMRSVETRLFRIHDSSRWLYPLRVWRGSARLQSEFYRARYSDAIRLPVVRDYVSRLVEEKQLGPTGENIRDLQASSLNLILLIIGGLSAILGVLGVLIAIFGH